MSSPDRVFTQSFVVVGGILERDGKILLVQEAGNDKGLDRGKWSHPAGWLDIGENPVDGAQREVLEETGYDWRPTHIIGLYSLVRKDIVLERHMDWPPGTPHALKIIFKGQIISNSPRPTEDDVLGTKWFTPQEIYGMDQDTLRDMDIKHIVRDYFRGNQIDMPYLTHTVQA